MLKQIDELAKREKIAHHFAEILRLLDQDIEDENLIETPMRVAKHLTEFLNWDAGNVETVFEAFTSDQMVILKNIPFYSLCSHHVLPFSGTISIGYITKEKIIGLSKLARIAQKHAHKLQLQEKLAHNIADELQEIINPLGVAVFIKAAHTCMAMRGVRSNGEMITSVIRGVFRHDASAKEEFLLLVRD